MKPIIFFSIMFLLLISVVYGNSFSSPYLPNQTVILQNDTDSYDYTIVFQNPQEEPATMIFQVEQGQEWLNITHIELTVQPKVYNEAYTIRISKPDHKISYNVPYKVVYSVVAISNQTVTKDKSVTVTGKIQKTFYVKIVKKQTPWLGIIVVLLLVVIISIIILKTRKKEKIIKQAKVKEL